MSDDDKKELLNTIKDRNISIENVSNNIYLVKQCNEMTDVFFERLMLKGRLSFFSHQLIYTKDSTIQWAGADIFVKVKKDNNINQLMKLLKVSYSNIRRWNDYCDDEFIITISSENALDCANRLYESGFFDYSQPSFFRKNIFRKFYYNYQWGLNNTGQDGGTSGIDINVEQAWNLSDGSGVIVALVDNGVDLTHPDIQANLLSGYDATGYASMGGYTNNDYHGTCCAGIICAKDNNIGIKGVAYNSHLIPIKMNSTTSFSYDTISTSAISFVCNNGASVISCSWGGGSGSAAITSAIIHFATTGRNGKGCVFVFSSGNNNMSSVEYPSNLDEVISVGAIDRCGARSGRIDIVPESCDPWDATWKPGSSYGEKLSVVAPGTNVYTTTINSNYTYFGGTSAACPHVAGVAALMLSVNPNLTAQEVRTIIEKTAQKVRPEFYHYTDTVGHPNGTWNKYTGYGLVDAYAAVKKAKEIDLYIRDSVSDNGTVPSNVAYNWNSPDIWIEDLSGNRVENPVGNTNYNVCVRIHNRSDYPSTGDERLFLNWAKAGINDYWYENWTSYNPIICNQNTVFKGGVIDSPNGIPLSSIPAHSSRIEKVQWRTPLWEDYLNCSAFTDDPWHFCLLARVHDADVIAHENEQQTGVYWLVRDHNNVAQKNIYLNQSASYKSVISISNPTSNSIIRFLCLLKRQNNFEEKITDFAEISLTLDADLISAINYDLLTGAKFVNDNTLLITDDDFVLPLQLTPWQYSTLCTSVNFFTNKSPQNDTTHFDIVAYTDENLSDIVSGQGYQNIYTTGRTFHANAGNDTAVMLNTTATLHATQINENATYSWYDKNRNFLYEGVNFSVLPLQTSEYILEVTALGDGYRDLDTVKVNVLPGCIRSITPNPVGSNWVVVSYEYAATVTSAQLLVYNTATATLVGNYDLSNLVNAGSVNVEVANYPAGSYTVVLVCDNTVCHSKTLIRQ